MPDVPPQRNPFLIAILRFRAAADCGKYTPNTAPVGSTNQSVMSTQ